jgi:hypothetical protein
LVPFHLTQNEDQNERPSFGSRIRAKTEVITTVRDPLAALRARKKMGTEEEKGTEGGSLYFLQILSKTKNNKLNSFIENDTNDRK